MNGISSGFATVAITNPRGIPAATRSREIASHTELTRTMETFPIQRSSRRNTQVSASAAATMRASGGHGFVASARNHASRTNLATRNTIRPAGIPSGASGANTHAPSGEYRNPSTP